MITCQLAIDDPKMRDDLEELLELLSHCMVKVEFLIEDMPPYYNDLNQVYSFIGDSFQIMQAINDELVEEE
jgi:hypothetical protein